MCEISPGGGREGRGAGREGKREERRSWEHYPPASQSAAQLCVGMPPPVLQEVTWTCHSHPVFFGAKPTPKDCCIRSARSGQAHAPVPPRDPASPVLLSPEKPCIRGGAASLSRLPQRPQQSFVPPEIHQMFPFHPFGHSLTALGELRPENEKSLATHPHPPASFLPVIPVPPPTKCRQGDFLL